jgi:autotransporter-associated beta strand protein
MFTNTAATILGSQYPGGIGNFELNMYGGDFAWTAPFDFYAGRPGVSHDVNLHGGVFTAPCLRRRESSAAVNFYWNGGTFRPTLDGASFRSENPASGKPSYDWTSVIVATNGAAFDIPGANTFTLNRSFDHESALGAEEDGGIIKRGTGTLLMSEANTFTGPCVVEAGVMKPTVAAAVPGGIVLAGGTFDCNGFAFTVPYLNGAGGEAINGTITVAGTMAPLDATMTNAPYATVTNLVFGENAVVTCPLTQEGDVYAAPYFRVTGSCTGGIMLDFGLANDVMLPTGLRVKVAEYTSDVTSFPAVKGRNFGIARRRHIGRETETDPVTGVTSVYAVLNPAGVALSFR